MKPPMVFSSKSSTSKLPTLDTNWMVSTKRLHSKLKNTVNRTDLHLGQSTGRKKPKGMNAAIFPNRFSATAFVPKVWRYTINRLISLNSSRL